MGSGNENSATICGQARKTVGFHLDERLDWVADLECGHLQHVRHNPSFTAGHWVTTSEGRNAYIGLELLCIACTAPLLKREREGSIRQSAVFCPNPRRTKNKVVTCEVGNRLGNASTSELLHYTSCATSMRESAAHVVRSKIREGA